MSEESGSSTTPNGTTASEKNASPRLSSFKLPRDLTLGGVKTTKKVFTPNLNVARNKNKGPIPNLREKRDNDKQRKDRHQKNSRNGPNIVKSSGVFSEGLGASERHVTRSSYGRDTDATPTLVKPIIRVKDVRKIDKELEDATLKKVLGSGVGEDDSGRPPDVRDAPVRLPISEGGTLYSVKREAPKVAVVKQEVVVKTEPEEDALMGVTRDEKPLAKVKLETFDSSDVVGLLKSDKPTLMLLQFPDNLPGSGVDEDPGPKHSGGEEESKPSDGRCMLTDLEEGKIGKILVYKSGKVKLSLGDTLFDLSMGTLPCFRQDAVSVAVNEETRTGTMINLGGIEKKLTVIPDWEAMFKDVVI